MSSINTLSKPKLGVRSRQKGKFILVLHLLLASSSTMRKTTNWLTSSAVAKTIALARPTRLDLLALKVRWGLAELDLILDLDPPLTPMGLELLRTKMSRGSRIKCSMYSWQVCCDKIRWRSRRKSAATFDHVYDRNMSVTCYFILPALAPSQSRLTQLSMESRTV